MKTSVFRTNGDKKRDIKIVNILIHFFALVHATACYILLTNSLPDGLFLTILTIIMIILLINFFNGTTEVFVSLSLLACLAGFYLGTKGALLIGYFINNTIFTHVIATALVTEIVGWLVFLILYKKSFK